jgi:two-component system sensor histidine kinase RpfC
VASRPLSVVDSARIKSFREAVVLEGPPAPRLIANAIHAAVATAGRDGGETIDLAQLLRQQRISLRVLVADDNSTNQAIISQLLASAGHTVVLAADGEEALDLYESESPDVALLDFNMPGRNGCEVIRAIRLMEPPGVHIPAIILSASVTPEAKTRAIDAGADEFVGKPFDAASLIGKVDRLASKVRPKNRTLASSVSVPTTPNSLPIERRKDSERNDAVLSYERLGEIEDISRNTNFTMELLRGFKSDVQSLLTRLDDSIRPGASERTADILHALKGAAVGVGAVQLANACNDLPPGVRNNAEKIAAAVRAIHMTTVVTFEHLDEYVRKQHRIAL